jgi:hypothetical protein
MARIDSLAAVEQVLATLTERGFARRLDRRPGQKEDRFEHLFGGSESAAAPATAAFTEPSSGAPVGEAVPSAPIASASNPAPAPIVMRHPAAVPAPGSSAPGSSAPGSSAPGSSAPGAPAPRAPAPRAPAPGPSDLEPRVRALESELANLREEAASLREELSALRREVQVGSASPTT